jgi:general secretion pathway protein C
VHARAATTPCQPVTADLQLDGTAVFESGGGLALLTAAGRPRLLKPGQQVLGHQLQRIRPGKLVFEHDGQMRCLTAARRTTSTRSRATSARPAGPRRIAPGQYAVDRRWLTRRLTDRQTLKGVRARPYVKNGRLAGFAIKTVPKGHVLRTLGIRPGDVIVGANGAPLSGTGQVLELYDALPEADGLSLSIRRRGRPVELDFAITGGR